MPSTGLNEEIDSPEENQFNPDEHPSLICLMPNAFKVSCMKFSLFIKDNYILRLVQIKEIKLALNLYYILKKYIFN